MAGLKDLLDVGGERLDVARAARLHVERIDALDGREEPQHGNRDQHVFAGELGKAEAFRLLLEGADHGELQSMQLHGLAHRRALAAKQAPREALHQQRDAVALRNVGRIEEPARQQFQIAHRGVIFIRPDDGHVFFLALDAHFVEAVHDAGGRHDARAQLLANRVDVALLHVIGVAGRGGHVVAALIGAVNQIGADALNLLKDVVAAGERNRHHQNDGGIADHQAERGEKGAEFVGLQRLPAEAQRFAGEHHAPIFLSRASAPERGGSPGVKGARR